MSERFDTFRAFYSFCLGEHSHRACRRLHFVGTSLVILTLLFAAAPQRYAMLWLMPLPGYGFAWIGHFFFEKNSPATFRFPLHSLLADFAMFKNILVGRIRF